MNSVLVAFSGGQDSTTALAWALDKYERVETIGFQYGQRHIAEMDARLRVIESLRKLSANWNTRLGMDHVIDVDLVGQLCNKNIAIVENNSLIDQQNYTSGARYIPGRNLIILSTAAVVAFRRDIRSIVCGVSETEYSGYPDCRNTSINAMNTAINLSTGIEFSLVTPLMALTKAGVWQLANELGGSDLIRIIIEHSHTCYRGMRSPLHEWGRGCGECPACKLRAKGWNDFLATGSFANARL